jgi:hypothetical protein
MQSSLPSKVKAATRLAFIGAPANDNSRLPRCLVRDGWWLEPDGQVASAIAFITIGSHHHD